MAEKGFSRGYIPGAHVQCLIKALPEDCVGSGIVCYTPGYKGRRAKYETGYFFRSPVPGLDIHEILDLAHVLTNNDPTFKKKSMTDTIKNLLAMDSDSLAGFRVMYALIKSCQREKNPRAR